MNEITSSGKNELTTAGMTGIEKAMVQAEFLPGMSADSIDDKKYLKVPASTLASYSGTATEAIKDIMILGTKAGGEGIYRVSFNGVAGSLAMKDGKFLGTVMSSGKIAGQSRMVPLAIDPTTLMITIAIAGIDNRLSQIQEKQQEILDFLEKDKESKLIGDLGTLNDIRKEYRTRWGDASFVQSRQILIQNIKRDSRANIVFYQQGAEQDKVKNITPILLNKDVREALANTQKDFGHYQLALYIYAYSSFLETLLSGSYSSEILANVKADLELQDRQYRRLYKKCADRIEKQANQAVDTQIMKGIAGVGKFAEGAASILPGMKKSQAPAKESFADKNGVGEVKRIMAQFEKSRESGIQPFEDNIRLLDYIHNEDASIAVSGENMYIPRLAPKRRILVVVDMQNDFISGSLGSKRGLEIVPAVVKKIQEYDPENVFATRDTHAEDYLSTQEGRLLPVEHCIKGTKGWEIAEDIKELIPEDHIFDKPTFGSVALAEYMKQQNDKTDIEIELVGLCTDICVISNALLLKAYMPEVTISVDPSCCGGVTKEKHDAALEAMRSCQIQVIDQVQN